MAARSIWKGELTLGTNKIPVKLYAAVGDQTVRFHILDKGKQRVKQHMVDPQSGDEVSEIRKGYEFAPGQFVIITDEELEGIKPKPSRKIEVTSFIPASKITQQWYERPYFLGPDGNEKDYFALAEALAKTEREGIADWVMRNKAYVGTLRAQGGYLLLSTLRHPEEVISAGELPQLGGAAPTQKEIDMAQQLVSMLEDEFRPEDYKDEYRDRVMKFIESKAKGHAPRLSLVKSKRATTSLDSALARSIASIKKGKRAA